MSLNVCDSGRDSCTREQPVVNQLVLALDISVKEALVVAAAGSVAAGLTDDTHT
jgi:hypothetical protein